jgi:hypothetical protein
MEFWVAAILILVCIGGAIAAMMQYHKKKKSRFIALGVLALLCAFALFVYIGLIFIFLGALQDEPIHETNQPTSQEADASDPTTPTLPTDPSSLTDSTSQIDPSSPIDPSASIDPPAPKVPILTEIDHYTLDPDDAAHASEEQKAWYRRLVDGVLAREESVTLSDSYDENLYCWGLLMSNPIYFVVEKVDFSSDHKTLLFTYAYSAEEQTEMISFIDKQYLTILNEIIPDDANDLEKVLRVYEYFSSHIEYNYEWLAGLQLAPEDFLYPDIQIYEALSTNFGVCHSYTYLCEFAFALLGIDSFGITGYDTNADGYHMWLLVKIDDHFYYLDPTWDRNQDGTVGLRYFGMTTERRTDTGLVDFDNFEAFHEPEYGSVPADDDRFSVLWDTYSFEFGPSHTLILYDEMGNTQIYDLVAEKIK